MTAGRSRGRKQILDDLKEKGGYWELKEEELVILCGELALQEVMDLS